MEKNESNPGRKHKNTHYVYAIMLIPGDWKKLFLHDQFHIVVAECLNQCVYEDGMHINGYLISYDKILLLLDEGHEAAQKLILFFEKIKKAIIRQKHLQYQDEHDNSNITLYHLFRKFPLYDNVLIHLITGRKLSLPYYDPEVERLKDLINKDNYCSVIDYSGAKGPVKVKLLSVNSKIIIVNVESISVKNEYLFE